MIVENLKHFIIWVFANLWLYCWTWRWTHGLSHYLWLWPGLGGWPWLSGLLNIPVRLTSKKSTTDHVINIVHKDGILCSTVFSKQLIMETTLWSELKSRPIKAQLHKRTSAVLWSNHPAVLATWDLTIRTIPWAHHRRPCLPLPRISGDARNGLGSFAPSPKMSLIPTMKRTD